MPNSDSDIPLLGALSKINDFLKFHKYDYCLIGGLAVQVRGEPRFTQDVDICILMDLSIQEEFINKVLIEFNPLVENALDLATSCQILPIVIEGITVDLSLGLTGFEEQVIFRAKQEKLHDDLQIKVATAEDLIIFKCIANRPKDIHDIDSLLNKNLDQLDLVYIKNNLKGFEKVLDMKLLSIFENRLAILSPKKP